MSKMYVDGIGSRYIFELEWYSKKFLNLNTLIFNLGDFVDAIETKGRGDWSKIMASQSGDTIILLSKSQSGKQNTKKLNIQVYTPATRSRGTDLEKGYSNDCELPVLSDDGQHLFLPNEVSLT